MTSGPAEFPATSWSMVLAARDGVERTRQLDRMFRRYWSPVYAYIRRAWNKPDPDARDLTQEFFVSLLERDFLDGVAQDKGRFRAYLRACLRHFLLDDRKRTAAGKRGGGRVHISIEGFEAPLDVPAASPDEAFDREWAYALLRESIADLERVLREMDRADDWEVFRALDVDPAPDVRPTYADVAAKRRCPEQEVKSKADYARKTLRRLVQARIRELTASDDDAASELRELFGGAGGPASLG